MNTNTGGPAFPLAIDKQVLHNGMTLRDHFAGTALQGFLAYAATTGKYAPPDVGNKP